MTGKEFLAKYPGLRCLYQDVKLKHIKEHRSKKIDCGSINEAYHVFLHRLRYRKDYREIYDILFHGKRIFLIKENLVKAFSFPIVFYCDSELNRFYNRVGLISDGNHRVRFLQLFPDVDVGEIIVELV